MRSSSGEEGSQCVNLKFEDTCTSSCIGFTDSCHIHNTTFRRIFFVVFASSAGPRYHCLRAAYMM